MSCRSHLLVLGLLFLALPAFSQPTSSAPPQKVALRFAAKLGDKPFACGQTFTNIGVTHATVTPTDLRFFVTHVKLLDAAGNETPVALDQDGTFQYRDLALVDLEDGSGGCRNGNPATHTAIMGTVPAGTYTGVRFTVGVPFDLNHLDPVSAPAPLNFTAMSWVWQAGFKFIRAEVAVKTPAPPSADSPRSASKPMGRESAGFPVHLGSTGCVSSSPTTAPATECAHPNRVVVTLTSFDPAADTVLFDFDHLLAASDVTRNTAKTSPGCMSFPNDPDCAPIFGSLGLAFNDAPAGEQTVFRTAPR